MNLATWAERSGVARVTAYRWSRAGLWPVPAQRVGRLILVDEAAGSAGPEVARLWMRGCRRRIRERIWIGRWRG
jgi:predicted site-specific integrase-resolvase